MGVGIAVALIAGMFALSAHMRGALDPSMDSGVPIPASTRIGFELSLLWKAFWPFLMAGMLFGWLRRPRASAADR